MPGCSSAAVVLELTALGGRDVVAPLQGQQPAHGAEDILEFSSRELREVSRWPAMRVQDATAGQAVQSPSGVAGRHGTRRLEDQRLTAGARAARPPDDRAAQCLVNPVLEPLVAVHRAVLPEGRSAVAAARLRRRRAAPRRPAAPHPVTRTSPIRWRWPTSWPSSAWTPPRWWRRCCTTPWRTPATRWRR